jgi:uncharacterized protein (DUF1330 family)
MGVGSIEVGIGGGSMAHFATQRDGATSGSLHHPAAPLGMEWSPTMKAYLVVDVEITDPVKYAEYIKLVPASIAKYGGTYLARGGRAERIEGSWTPHRVVVVRFDSFERAKEWWSCGDYAAAKAIRQSASITNMLLVEGVA